MARRIHYLLVGIILFWLFMPLVRAEDKIVFGITPWEKPAVLNQMFKPLMKHLENRLGKTIIFTVAKDYGDLVQRIKLKKIDIGIFPPIAYVNAKASLPDLKYMLTVIGETDIESGKLRDSYKGVIICLKKSNIRKLEDLRGKRFGFTDINSSSGYKYPKHLLQSRGIDPETFFSKIFMLKKHPKITQALVNKAIEGGATWDGHLAKAIHEHGDIFRILDKTDPIPYDAWAAGPHVSRKDVQKIKSELLKLQPQGVVLTEMRKHGAYYWGWKERSDAYYNPVCNIAGLPPVPIITRKINLGITPWEKPDVLKKMHAPLMKYLSQELGKKVVFRVAKNYQELGERIQNQSIDVGFFAPRAYVHAKDEIPGLRYLLTFQKKDQTGQVRDHYKGVIVALKTSPYYSIQDLKGKRFAFTDYQSASGYLYPRALMKKQGINPKTYFSKVFMLKRHPKVTQALFKGVIDGGATWDANLKASIQKYDDVFRVIAETKPIPLDNIAVGPHVSYQDSEAIKKAFLKLDADSPVIKKMQSQGYPFCGVTVRNDAFYNVVREVGDRIY